MHGLLRLHPSEPRMDRLPPLPSSSSLRLTAQRPPGTEVMGHHHPRGLGADELPRLKGFVSCYHQQACREGDASVSGLCKSFWRLDPCLPFFPSFSMTSPISGWVPGSWRGGHTGCPLPQGPVSGRKHQFLRPDWDGGQITSKGIEVRTLGFCTGFRDRWGCPLPRWPFLLTGDSPWNVLPPRLSPVTLCSLF